MQRMTVALALVFWAGAKSVSAGTLPESIPLKPYLTGAATPFQNLVSFQEIPGKPGSYLVVGKNGTISAYEPKTGRTSLWLRTTVHTAYEEGVTSLAFHPDFRTNGRYFILSNPSSNGALPPLNIGRAGKRLIRLPHLGPRRFSP